MNLPVFVVVRLIIYNKHSIKLSGLCLWTFINTVDEIIKAIWPILLFFSSLVDDVPTEDKALKILFQFLYMALFIESQS